MQKLILAAAWIYLGFLGIETAYAAGATHSKLDQIFNVVGFTAFLVAWPGSIYIWSRQRPFRLSSWFILPALVVLGFLVSPIYILKQHYRAPKPTHSGEAYR